MSMAQPKPIDWPTDEWKFWWMEYQRTARSKVNVLLVSVVKHDDDEYIQPHEDRNCYPRSFTDEWQARFIPCETPPVFPTKGTDILDSSRPNFDAKRSGK